MDAELALAKHLNSVWPHLFNDGFQHEVAREAVKVIGGDVTAEEERMKLGATDSERREFAILTQSGHTWESYMHLTKARDHIAWVNEQLAGAGSAQRWAVLSSSDPARESTATCEKRQED